MIIGNLNEINKKHQTRNQKLKIAKWFNGWTLALQIGHRISVDLDLFGTLTGDVISLNKILAALAKRVRFLN